jgi:two-component system, LytTR family, sensor kinase
VGDLRSSPKPATSRIERPKGAEIDYPGLWMMFLIWMAFGALASVRNYFMFPSQRDMWELTAVVAYTACFYSWIALTPIVFRIEKRFPLGAGRWVRNLALLAIISVPFCLLASPLMMGSFLAVGYALNDQIWMPRSAITWFLEFPVAEAIFLALA